MLPHGLPCCPHGLNRITITISQLLQRSPRGHSPQLRLEPTLTLSATAAGAVRDTRCHCQLINNATIAAKNEMPPLRLVELISLIQLPGTVKVLVAPSTRFVSSCTERENAFGSGESRTTCIQVPNVSAHFAPCSWIIWSSHASFHHAKS